MGEWYMERILFELYWC